MPTLKDVARLADVSTATVSHVLNGKKKVSPEVAERVLRAVSETGYRLNTAARSLRTGRTGILGLIVPDITNPFFPQLAQAVEARAKTAGYATVLLESGYQVDTEAQGLDFLARHRVDGLIWVMSGGPPRHAQPDFPTVVVDYAPPSWNAVHADDYGGGRLQARFAVEAGHRRVALLWGPLTVTSIQERRRGFLEEAGPHLEIVHECSAPFGLTLPRTTERELLRAQGDYSLIVCGNDMLAVAALRALKRAGLDVPGQVSVIGFDDTSLAQIVEPPLTTIAQPVRRLGNLAVEQLLELISGAQQAPRQQVVPVTLKERGSTRRLTLRAAPTAAEVA
jgi:LacI family transcriptional regulator